MFSIGEFARLGGVSVRTLRHYDEIGLLRPASHGGAGHTCAPSSAPNQSRSPGSPAAPMRDPAGLVFCVIPEPPGELDDSNARRWD